MKRTLALLTASCAVFGSFPAHLRGARPLPEEPATVTFRCTATVPDTICPSDALVPDGIRGDGYAYSAKLDSVGEAFLSLTHGGGRTVWLDFRSGPSVPCPSCRRDFDTLFLDDVVIHTNVSDASGMPVTGGLTAMPVGATSPSRLKIAFNRLNALGQTVQWGIRFNPVDYPGSDLVTARRLTTTTWEVEAYPTDRAVVFSTISRVRNSDQTEKPLYMPFKMTIVSPVQ